MSNLNTVNSIQVLEIAKGEDITIRFSSISDLNISGYTFSFEVKNSKKRENQTSDIVKTLADGITVLEESTGKLEIDIDSADTVDLNPGLYDWELWRTNSGNRKRLAFGNLNLVKSIKIFN